MRTAGTLSTTPAPSATPKSLARVSQPPWHSPVPYLFGGLAAMLGLIAFALLILACSYWKLPGNFDNEEDNDRDLENGDEKIRDASLKPPPVYEEKFVVIMAGDEKATYLATPVSSRASSFGSNSRKEPESAEKTEKQIQDSFEEEHRADENGTSTTEVQSTHVPEIDFRRA